MKNIIYLVSLIFLLNVNITYAKCMDSSKIKEIIKGAPITPIIGLEANITLEDAYCNQNIYVTELKKLYGEPIGYKVGFTGKATQERFKISKPATGVLFKEMFIKNGSSINKGFGHRTLIEPDLMVIIKDSNIMSATNDIEAAKSIKSIHPFMEIPALQIAKGEPINGAILVSLNMLATKMVMGPGIKFEATPEFIKSLGKMETIFTDENNSVIQTAPGSALLGNPINVILWLIKEFNNKGIVLKENDRISLGSVGKLFPLVDSGKVYTYTLKGLSNKTVSTSIKIN